MSSHDSFLERGINADSDHYSSLSSSSRPSRILVRALAALVFILTVLTAVFAYLYFSHSSSSSASSSVSQSGAIGSLCQSLHDQFHSPNDLPLSVINYMPKVQNDSIWNFLVELSNQTHIAGTEANNATAQYVAQQFRSFGLNTRIEEYDVLLSYPKRVSVQVTLPNGQIVNSKLRQQGFPSDPQTRSLEWKVEYQYLAYAKSGRADNRSVIYANYGSSKDFAYLTTIGIQCNGCIVLMRYGSIFRGNKVSNAQAFGASAALLYMDPADAGYDQGPMFPAGPWSPNSATMSGTIYNGNEDPSTPGISSSLETRPYRLTGSDLRDPNKTFGYPLPAIPAFPISAEDALPILAHLAGPEAPKDWQGGLLSAAAPNPFNLSTSSPYRIGLGHSAISDSQAAAECLVSLDLEMSEEIRRIVNVIAEIEGNQEPDRWIIAGNHRDAWQFGTADPSSGMAALMEVARVFGDMLAQGWRPGRSIRIASWDAEEFGLLGSSEHAERFEHHYLYQGIAYLNVDIAVEGTDFFQLEGQEQLTRMVRKLMNLIPMPQYESKGPGQPSTLLDSWGLDPSWQSSDPNSPPVEPYLTASNLGISSDYGSFLHRLGLFILAFRFQDVNQQYEAVYHTIYDNLDWMKQFGDPDMQYHRVLTQFWGSIMLVMADSPIVEARYTDYLARLSQQFHDMSAALDYSLASDPAIAQRVNQSIAWTQESLQRTAAAGTVLDSDLQQWIDRSADVGQCVQSFGSQSEWQTRIQLRSLNDRLIFSERGWLFFQGIFPHGWCRNIPLYPSDFDVDGGSIWAMVSDPWNNGQWAQVETNLGLIREAAQQIRQLMIGSNI